MDLNASMVSLEPRHVILPYNFILKSPRHVPWGVHLLNLLHNMTIDRILNNIPNFTKYWKISHKIVLLNPPSQYTFPIKKTHSFTR